MNTPAEVAKYQKYSILALRISLGWLFLYAGFSKLINPEWSAAGYLNAAKTFTDFYVWLASGPILSVTNFLNEWGLFLIGASLLLGVAIRWSAPLGAAMMLLYYFPILDFPKVGANAFIIDEHIIYAVGFFLLATYCRENPEWFKRLLKR